MHLPILGNLHIRGDCSLLWNSSPLDTSRDKPSSVRLKLSLVKTNSFTCLVLRSDKKVNLSLCIIKHYAVKVYGVMHDISALTSHGVMSWDSLPGRFNLRERAMDLLSSGDHSSCRNVIISFEGRKVCYSRPQWPRRLRLRLHWGQNRHNTTDWTDSRFGSIH
jgi:hypothetical protein